MLLRIGKDTETIASFKGVSFDPALPFQAVTPDDELLDNVMFDPGLLIAELALDPGELAVVTAEMALRNSLRQQQYIVYDIASRVGVLSPFVGTTQNALKAFDVILTDLDTEMATAEAITTSIGVASMALSAIPTIYTQIASAIVNVGLWVANMVIEYQAEIPQQRPAQEYSKDTDVTQFNQGVRKIMHGSLDWTSIFSPRFSGSLAAQVREDDYDRIVIAFAPGNGRIAKVGVTGKGKKRKATFPDSGAFDPTGGLGMVPGGQRIFSVVQITPTEEPEGPSGFHPTLFDPRCGSTYKSTALDVGAWYPVTAQGALSLWDFLWQRGAAMYTVDPVSARIAWKHYFDSIWDGVDRTWGRTAWQGNQTDMGWGCGFWQNALQDLIANYTVSVIDGKIGGAMSWRPSTLTEADQGLLSGSDENLWDKYNAYTKIIKPALDQLETAQIWYLENTTIAAYLPIDGGKNADPLGQDRVMGAFGAGRKAMRDRFNHARNRILNGPAKYEVRLRDVLDPIYRAQIENAGGGTQAVELGFTAKMPGEPAPFQPEGGTGLPLAPFPQPVAPKKRGAWPFIAGGLVTSATALSYFYWDDAARVVAAARQRLPKRLR